MKTRAEMIVAVEDEQREINSQAVIHPDSDQRIARKTISIT